MPRMIRCLFVVSIAIPLIFVSRTASAISYLRDAEIERAMQIYTADILDAANLDKDAIRLHLLNSPIYNASAGGRDINFYSGFLIAAETPDEVIGVIAHEAGHLIGGHSTRLGDAMSSASKKASISFIIGILAAAAGSPSAGAAVMGTGQQAAYTGLAKFSQVQESAADQAAIKLLRRTGRSPEGLYASMKRIQGMIAHRGNMPPPYARSHPAPRRRMSTFDEAIKQSPYVGMREPEDVQMLHRRVRAKLIGFLHSFEDVLNRYPQSDQSIPARYARAIAYHRRSQIRPAMAEISSLLVDLPDDGYILELKAQIFYEHGKFEEAVKMYEAAARQLPHEPLILAALGVARLDLKKPQETKKAISNLNASLAFDPENLLAWLKLAVAYNNVDNPGMANLATAERYVRMAMYSEAMDQALRASRKLPKSSAGWIRANDIQNLIRNLPRPRRRRPG